MKTSFQFPELRSEILKEFEDWREKQHIPLCRYSDISVELEKVTELAIQKATENTEEEIFDLIRSFKNPYPCASLLKAELYESRKRKFVKGGKEC